MARAPVYLKTSVSIQSWASFCRMMGSFVTGRPFFLVWRLAPSAQVSSEYWIYRLAALAVTDAGDVPVRRAVLDYLWSLQYTIAAGTSQVQRNLIAERILGLPRE